MDEVVARAVAELEAGRIVGVPTDTVYGLAVDPWNEEAVASLYEVKGRPGHKPVGLLAASIAQIETVADLGAGADLVRRHWPGALTLVVRPVVVIPDWVGDSALGTVGVRVPDAELLTSILEQAGPLAVTSANRSGGDETRDDGAARRLLGDSVAYYVPGVSSGGIASTVVDVTGAEPVVLRQGPVVIDQAV